MKVLVDYDLIPARPDLIPVAAGRVLAKVFGYGSLKHPEGAWRSISVDEHIGKALGHLCAGGECGEDGSDEDHLANALCRLYMAVQLREEKPANHTDTTS